MTVASTTSATSTTATTSDNSAMAELGGNFDMFLKLLTTQMQNQDPLDPMDTSQYTQQLVQYSQVEQSIQQNSTLKDILSRLSAQDMAQASSFIGREAEFASGVSGLSDKPAQWNWTADRQVSTLTATITDSTGRVVETRTVTPSQAGRFSWDGTLTGGGQAPAGSYTLSLAAVDASGASVPVTVHSIGTVDEVTAANGVVSLGVNGAQLDSTSLVRLAAAA